MEKDKKNVKPEHLHNWPAFLEKQSNVHAIAYIPYFIGAALAFFLGKTDKKMIMHHVKYSLILSVAAVLLLVILNGFFASLISLAYLGLSGYFGFKAYKGEAVTVEILDTIEEKISEKVGK